MITKSDESYKTIEQVAELLNVSYQVIRNLIVEGKLRAFKAGRQWRIKESELDKYIEKRSTSLIHS